MLDGLRRRLRLIRYYSVPRRRTAWTRALDLALLLALLAAWPVVFVADAVHTRPRVSSEVAGTLSRAPDGALIATLFAPGRATADVSGDLQPYGLFTLRLEEDRHGWPFATSVDQPPPRTDLDLFARSGPQFDLTLAPGDPVRTAIERSLADDERGVPFADRWRRGGPERRYRWLALGAGGLVWWVILYVLAALVILCVRAWATTRRRHRHDRRSVRRAEGRCAHCGYDLRGLEFNERCPECGHLV